MADARHREQNGCQNWCHNAETPAGFVADERTPHAGTLDAIARYLGYDHWEQLTAIADQGNSGFDITNDEIRSVDLQMDAQVEIAYLPDRRVTLQFLGGNSYRVVESHNSSLHVGDEVSIQNFVLHHPLFVADVLRDGHSLGAFTAGRIDGLQSLVLINS